MKILILRRSSNANFGLNSGDAARRLKAIIMPPLPPRPMFVRSPQTSGLNPELQLGLVRKIDRQTGKMHLEKRRIKTPGGSLTARLKADAEAKVDTQVKDFLSGRTKTLMSPAQPGGRLTARLRADAEAKVDARVKAFMESLGKR